MLLPVSATRMELLRLQKRRAIAVRGHKLLKDKLEGLIQEFLVIVDRYREVHDEVRRELPRVLQQFLLARMTSSTHIVEQALAQVKSRVVVRVGKKKIMGVEVPEFQIEEVEGATSYSLLDTPAELDEAVGRLDEVFKKVVRLAELEQTVRLLAQEIERTRRRTNALEYTFIPQITSAIRMIKSKLEEIERGNITRLMKVKEMLAAR